jgi:hypothetical protein
MPATTIGTSLQQGFPGTVSRSGDNVIWGRQVQATDVNGPAFGAPCVINANNTYSDVGAFIAGGGTLSMPILAGVAVREAKSFTNFLAQSGVLSYQPGDTADVLLRGECPVVVGVGTPVAGGPVFIRVSANGANTLVGGYEAAADGAHTFTVTNAKFTTGVMDANGVAEIAILSRVV